MASLETTKAFSLSTSTFDWALNPVRNKKTLHASAFLAVIADLVSLFASALAALTLRFPLAKILHERLVLKDAIFLHFVFLVLYAVILVIACNSQRLYSRFQMYSGVREMLAVTNGVSMASLVLMGAIYLSGARILSRVVIVSTILLTLVCMIAWRSVRRHLVSNRAATADGVTRHNVLIVGTDFLAEALQNYINQHREFGLVVTGLLAATDQSAATAAAVGSSAFSLSSDSAAAVLGTVADLPRLCQSNFIDEVIVCAQNRETVRSVLEYARAAGIGVRIVPDLYDGMALGAPIDYLGSFPTIALHHKHIPAVALTLKRLIDIVISSLGILFLSPVLLAVALAVRLDSSGSILYSSVRVGKKGRTFKCLKFRTMVANADQLREKLKHMNERDSILFKIAQDPRITRVGRYLRKYSLDELPQLFNVLKGEMSIVGPRPPLANEVELYELEYLRRLEVPPGITGLWQVEARSHPSFERYIALDLQYVEEWTLFMDLKILFRTIGVVVAGTGS